jgi:hypothetical protein
MQPTDSVDSHATKFKTKTANTKFAYLDKTANFNVLYSSTDGVVALGH